MTLPGQHPVEQSDANLRLMSEIAALRREISSLRRTGGGGGGGGGSETDPVASAALAAHEADTTAIHGIANTANLVLTSDPRLVAATRATTTVTTGSLANLAEEAGAATIAAEFLLLSINPDRACRLRLYSTAAARDADAARAIGVDPADNTGLIYDHVAVAAGLHRLSPVAAGANFDTTVTNTVYWRVQNRSGSTAAVSIALVAKAIETV